MKRLLLCPPDFYDIRYEINPWMSLAQTADRELAESQWRGLRDRLKSLGCEVEVMSAQHDWPDMVFTANAGLVKGNEVLLANFRHLERAGEALWYEKWFGEHGFDITRLPAGIAFEGEGDALKCGDHWCCAVGSRSDVQAHQNIAVFTGDPVVSVLLVNPRYYHLDTCFCPLGNGLAMWYPPAFDSQGQAALQSIADDLLEVPEDEAARFACNAVILGRNVVLPEGCPQTEKALRERNFHPHALPMSEFIKAGGACKCLVLMLN